MNFENKQHLLYFTVYCAVACAVALFLFIMVFVLLGKGKRRCTGADIAFRIFASLSLAVSVVMFVASGLASLDGGTRIEIADDVAKLVFGSDEISLPCYGLFVALSATGISELNAGLVIVSITALTADCMLANLKDGGKKKAAAEKSDAQTMRDAEIERIRRLANEAVRKTEGAANTAKEKSEEAPDAVSDSVDTSADEDFDWRVDPPEKKTEFVGLESVGGDFDTFDGGAEEGTAPDDCESEETDGETPESAFMAEADGGTEETDEDEEKEITDGDFDDTQNADGLEDGEDSQADDGSVDTVEEFEAEKREADGERQKDGYGADGGKPISDADEYEPDRDIYIPKIRTIERSTPKKKPTAAKPKKADGASSERKPKGGGKSATGKKTASGATGKKSGGKPRTDVRSEARTLPVTKRYVILDRTSAVNIFSEYLKERDKADKERLESNIETIIIK